ncbi:MAG: hypothetical protein CMP48_25370 [Rickettsiales bacterium]|nr:hypothetical protein [Rickettsiales bacterium]
MQINLSRLNCINPSFTSLWKALILLVAILTFELANGQTINSDNQKEYFELADSMLFYRTDIQQSQVLWKSLMDYYQLNQEENRFIKAKGYYAESFMRMGDSEMAKTISEELIDQARLMNQPFNVNLAKAYYLIALYNNNVERDRQKALKTIYDGLDKTTKIPGSKDLSANTELYYLAAYEHRMTDDLPDAIKMAELAAKVDVDHRKSSGIYPEWILALAQMSRFEEAQKRANEYYEISQLPSVPSYYEKYALQQLAYVYELMGKYQEAAENRKMNYENLLKEYGPDNGETQLMRMDYGMDLIFLGRLDEAIKTLKESLVEVEKYYQKGYEWIVGSNNLAAAYRINGDLQEAMQLEKEVLKTAMDNPQIPKSQIAEYHDTMGQIYFKMGKFDSATVYYKRSLQLWEESFGTNNQQYIQTLNKISRLQIAQGNYNTSIEASSQVRSQLKAQHGENWRIGLQFYSPLAYGYYLSNKYDSASEILQEDNAYYLKYIRDYFSAMTEFQRKKFYGMFEEYISAYLTICMKSADKVDLDQLFSFQQQTKGILLNSEVAVQKRIRAIDDRSVQNLYDQTMNLKSKMGRYLTLSEDELSKLNLDLDHLTDSLSNLENELIKISGVYNQPPVVQSLVDISKSLKGKEVVVEIIKVPVFDFNSMKVSDEVAYMAMLIFKDSGKNRLVVLENGNQIEKYVSTLYQNSQKYQMVDDLTADIVWGPIEKELSKTKRIFINNDGIYHRVNLQTLYNSHSGKYVGDEYQFINISSVNDIPGFRESIKLKTLSGASNDIVLFGNPDFGDADQSYDDTRSSWGALPGTKKEVMNIVDLIESDHTFTPLLFTEENATEHDVKEINSPMVLHIATHGFFETQRTDLKDPLLRTGLLFKGANSGLTHLTNELGSLSDEDDGVLTAFEAQLLNLNQTQLVVLSACETGLGELENGQGVYGLQYSLKKAGAEHILMSLWKVDDEVTQELMTSFYQYWLSGKSLRKAFSKAQRHIQKQYEHPYYWGAFILN